MFCFDKATRNTVGWVVMSVTAIVACFYLANLLSQTDWLKEQDRREQERIISNMQKNTKKEPIVYTRDPDTDLCFAWSRHGMAHVPCISEMLE